MIVSALILGIAGQIPSPMSAQQDHARLLKELGIERLRPGKDGMNPKNPNFANTDEAKSNPYPTIPALMTFNDGRAVASRRDWPKRRAEIVELLDREIYGRTPKRTPGVKWEVVSTENVEIGGVKAVSQSWLGTLTTQVVPRLKLIFSCHLLCRLR